MTSFHGLKKEIYEKNLEIIEFLKTFPITDMSILHTFGNNWTLMNYGLHFSDEQAMQLALNNVEETVSSLNIEDIKYNTYSQGLVSTGLLLKEMDRLELIEVGEEFFEVIDQVGTQFGDYFISQEDFDFFHGSTGIAAYCFAGKMHSDTSRAYIDRWLDAVSDRMDPKEIRMRFVNSMDPERKQMINTGLSHGLSAILKQCIRMREAYKDDQRVTNIINSITALFKRNYSEEHYPYFYPGLVEHEEEFKTSERRNRLGWCYGDLTVGYVLYQAAKVIQDSVLEGMALTMLKATTTRRTLQETSLSAPSLCHGFAGTGHIYNHIYHMTNEPAFEEAAEYWFQRTIDHAKKGVGNLGFENPQITDHKEDENGFLTGVGGISLAFQSYLNSNFDWDMILMLDEI